MKHFTANLNRDWIFNEHARLNLTVTDTFHLYIKISNLFLRLNFDKFFLTKPDLSQCIESQITSSQVEIKLKHCVKKNFLFESLDSSSSRGNDISISSILLCLFFGGKHTMVHNQSHLNTSKYVLDKISKNTFIFLKCQEKPGL